MDRHILWQDEDFVISTPMNPHVAYSEGLQLIVSSKEKIANAWQDPTFAGRVFELAAKACKVMEGLKMAPWFNIQANGNWGLLPGATPSFHIHIFGRNRTSSWTKPIVLPEAPNTYQNDPMPGADRSVLISAFKAEL